ncbi:hypothetical protein Golob_022357 [Gossypium lobatum]|uniref:Uncharacterized protein n=2 Tax=Gossypium TaxID=3633 RepID=A0A7J8WQY2_GOSAI|nr:hypothetical protein [Gossypium lobatum]MBA0677447.1 hypothetical protein [Gossypium aridum]
MVFFVAIREVGLLLGMLGLPCFSSGMVL